MRRTTKVILISVLSVGFLIGAFFSIKYFYKQHKQRFLKEAQAYIELGDKKSAVPLYQKHLLMNPKDNQNKIVYASLLNEIGEKEEALEVYKVLLLNDINDDWKSWIKNAIYWIYNSFIEEKSELAEKALKSKKYDEARECYENISNFIKFSIEIKEFSSTEYNTLSYSEQSKLDILFKAFEELNAKYAFSYWLEGNQKEAYEIAEDWFILDFAPVYVPDEYWEYLKNKRWLQKDSYYAFAAILYDEAQKAFDKKKWDVAIEGYKKASEYYERSKAKAVGFASESLYNCAMAYWNRGSLTSARRTLNTLKRKYPDYEVTKINQLINENVLVSKRKVAKRYRDEAFEYFNNKDWINARVSFFKSIESFKKAGEPDNSNLIGEIRLNIAYTYSNGKNYVKAKEVLLEIQKKNAEYEPILVKEELENLEKLLKIFK